MSRNTNTVSPWEPLGRGIAIFNTPSRPSRLDQLSSMPGTAPIPTVDGTIPDPTDAGTERILLPHISKAGFKDVGVLSNITRLFLEAYWLGLPVYASFELPFKDLAPRPLPMEDYFKSKTTRLGLIREQLWMLICQGCSVMNGESKDQESVPPLPLVAALSKAMRESGIDHSISPGGNSDLTLGGIGFDISSLPFAPSNHARGTGSGSNVSIHAGLLHSNLQGVMGMLRNPESKSARIPVRPADTTSMKLSPQQERCLHPRQGVVMTLAPAGSGKTRVLTARVMDAVGSGADPSRILCVVFNVDARKVMQERIHGGAGLKGVAIKTLHALGHDILIKNPDSPYFGWNIIQDEMQLRTLYMRVMTQERKEGRRLSPEDVDQQIEADAIFKRTLAKAAKSVKSVMERVDKDLGEARQLTFDDLIYRSVELLLSEPRIRRQWQNRWDMLLVDEFQDLTPMQSLLVRILSMPLDNLFVVGDDDQMVNLFACADPRNIGEFEGAFHKSVIHTLGTNYRSHPDIVEASAKLIKGNTARVDKPIAPVERQKSPRTKAAKGSGALRMNRSKTLTGEVRIVVNTIAGWATDGMAYEDMAILVRVQSLASPMQSALELAGIPYHTEEASRLYTSAQGRILGAYLRLCANPEVVSAQDLVQALKAPTRYLTREEMVKVGTLGWKGIQGKLPLEPFKAKNVTEFACTVRRVAKYVKAHDKDGAACLRYLLDRFSLEEELMDEGTEGSFTEIAMGMAEEADGFRNFTDYFTGQQGEESTRAKQPRPVGDRKRLGVSLKTIHKSKGEEYRAVVLLHVVEGVLPHSKALKDGSPGDIEEERRVCYVGVTRAIERLLITTQTGKESRFLGELGVD